MSPDSYGRARLRKITVIAATGAIIAAGLLVPSSAYADAPDQTKSNVLDGTSLSDDGWTGPATNSANGYDFNTDNGVLQASNVGANGVITQLESPVTLEAGEPGYTNAAFDSYHFAFTLDGHAIGADKYAKQPGVALEVDADEGGNRAGGGLYFTVPEDNELQIDNFSSTDPFGQLWSGAHQANIPFNGAVTIDYTVKFVAGGQDVVTVKANNTTILSSAGTYEGYSFASAASSYLTNAAATTPNADKVDQVLFRATHSHYNSAWTPGNTDVNVAPYTALPDVVPTAPGGGFTFSDLTYGAQNSSSQAFGSTSTIATAANQIADYEDASTYNSWHIGNNPDSTDTSDYFDVLPSGDVQLNDLDTSDTHSTQLLHGIPAVIRPTDLYALVAQGIAWTIPTSNLASFQIALTATAINPSGSSHFATLHSESNTETGGLNVVRLSDPWVTSKQVGNIPPFTNAPLGAFLAQLEPGVAIDPNSATAEPTAAITAANVSVLGFGVANEANSGQSATKVGPIYFGGVKYTFSAASAITLATPVVTGTPAVGVQLKASAAVTPTAAVPTYQWLRNGVAIAGTKAKAQKYTITSADYGKKLSVKVTEALTGFTKASKTSARTATVTAGTITRTGTVAINGVAKVGIKLSVTKPTYSPTPSIYSYQWHRNSTAISGATGSTYTVAPADLGATITVTVTAKKAYYHWLQVTSAATAAVVPGVLAVSASPTITGTLKTGKTLTATSGGWTANGVASSSLTKRYFWFVSSGTGTPSLTDLVQASSSPKLLLAYWAKGLKVSVYVVGVRDGFTGATSSLSAFTATVQ